MKKLALINREKLPDGPRIEIIKSLSGSKSEYRRVFIFVKGEMNPYLRYTPRDDEEEQNRDVSMTYSTSGLFERFQMEPIARCRKEREHRICYK